MWISKPRVLAMAVVALAMAAGAAIGASGTPMGWVGAGICLVVEAVLVCTRHEDMHVGD